MNIEKKKNIKMLVLAFFLFSCANNVFGKNIDFNDVSMTQVKKNSFIKENLKTIIAGTAGITGTLSTYFIQTKKMEKIQETADNAKATIKEKLEEITEKKGEITTLKDELIQSQSKRQEEGVLLIKDKDDKEHKISFEDNVKDIFLIENDKAPKKKISKANLNITSGSNKFNINTSTNVEVETEILRRSDTDLSATSTIITNIAGKKPKLFEIAIESIAVNNTFTDQTVNKIMSNLKVNTIVTQKKIAAEKAAVDAVTTETCAALLKIKTGSKVDNSTITEDVFGKNHTDVFAKLNDVVNKIETLKTVPGGAVVEKTEDESLTSLTEQLHTIQKALSKDNFININDEIVKIKKIDGNPASDFILKLQTLVAKITDLAAKNEKKDWEKSATDFTLEQLIIKIKSITVSLTSDKNKITLNSDEVNIKDNDIKNVDSGKISNFNIALQSLLRAINENTLVILQNELNAKYLEDRFFSEDEHGERTFAWEIFIGSDVKKEHEPNRGNTQKKQISDKLKILMDSAKLNLT